MNKIHKIEDTLKEKGYKLTGQRRLIIEAFESDSSHYTAQEVFESVKAQNPSINFSTVYRNLELLCKLGIVHKLNINSGMSHFELKDSGHHHHHMICLQCGEMQGLDLCPYSETYNKKLREMGFQAVEHKFEIYGYCKKCNEV